MSSTPKTIEVFDRVKIKETAAIKELRGKEGTVAFFGASGVNIAIENFPDPVPLLWSELEVIDWSGYGEEE